MRFSPVLLILALVAGSAFAQPKTKSQNLILITLDGMRWQEVFNGADLSMINNKKLTDDSLLFKNKYWSDNNAERRNRLMPFLWGTIGTKGQLYGNRDKGNKVNVTNQMWFSYPGYNEILTGAADDVIINSNDKNDNPHITVLEFLNQQPAHKNKVVAFTSWDAFPAIINTKRNKMLVNSGIELYKAPKLSETQQLLNDMTSELPYLGETRPDAVTFHLGFEYLKQNKPSVLYLSFDETDHFAHEGKYDLYLNSARYTDGFISKLWAWLQTQPQYKDKTTLIVTSDHGRGAAAMDMWKHHGKKVEGADQIWMAIMGPDTPALGEMKTEGQLYQNQVAKTLAAFLGYNFVNDKNNEGAVIQPALKLK